MRTYRAVHDTVITADADNATLPGTNLARLAHVRFYYDRPHRNDNSLWWIDDCIELFNSVSTQVRHRNCATLILFRLQLFGPCSRRQVLDLGANLAQALFL